MFASLIALGLAFASSVSATVNGPVINQNFPDPCIITVNGVVLVPSIQHAFSLLIYFVCRYAFATNSGGINIQTAKSTDNGVTWTVLGSDALPDVGSWATTGSTWAPDVINRGDGTFVLCA